MERPHRPRPDRLGFTLVESLIVIMIIVTLLALLIPTISAAVRRAKEAQVAAEMNNLATALASFKNAYGDYPPSRVLLCEQGYSDFISGNVTGGITPSSVIASDGDSNVSDMNYIQLAQRSMLIMKRFWNRCDFMHSPISSSANWNSQLNTNRGHFNDFNGDGLVDPNNLIILNGSECLAFFLGGIPILNGTKVTGLSGFSKSPLFPFVDGSQLNNIQVAPNRTVPNYEFNTSRLVDQDGDLIPSYLDPFDLSPGNRRGYAYFASYGVNSYDPNDVNGYGHSNAVIQNAGISGTSNFEEDDNSDPTGAGVIFVERGFTVSFPPNSVVSPAPNPYTSGPPVSPSVSWINASSFQIISAGQDRQFGMGGTFSQNDPSGTGSLPIYPNPKNATSGPSDLGNVNNETNRTRENDNITNFASGRLQ